MHPEKLQREVSKFFGTQLKSYVGFERKLAATISKFLTTSLGSMWFLNISITFISIWTIVNLGWIPMVEPFDPYPFVLLMMLISFCAVLLAIVVLININQQGRMSDVRQRIEFEVNVRAEQEITKMLTMLEELRVRVGMVKADTELDSMKKEIDIAEIKEDVEHGIEEGNG
ncbi:MAG: DUF1003 domain-containing protein [bacterium]|nr:DUF1003 domain-containing protein [bacterium]